LSSSYSKIFGVPLELLALGYFLVNLALVFLVAFGSERLSSATFEVLFGWRFIGIILVPYLVFVELFIIHAICVYCTMMHVAIVADFVAISYLLFFGKHALWREDAVEDGPTMASSPAIPTRLVHFESSDRTLFAAFTATPFPGGRRVPLQRPIADASLTTSHTS
jgi:hypothetical protein